MTLTWSVLSRLLVCDVKAVTFLGMTQKHDSALLGVSCSVSVHCVLNDITGKHPLSTYPVPYLHHVDDY